MNTADKIVQTLKVRVLLGGEERIVSRQAAMQAAQELHEKHGGIPKFEDIPDDAPAVLTDEVIGTAVLVSGEEATKVIAALATEEVVPGHIVTTEGKLRSMIDFAEAEAEGFAPRQTLYERGTAVIQAGADNARRSRLAWGDLPEVDSYCSDFMERIKAENRSDRSVEVHKLRMTVDGRIGVPSGSTMGTMMDSADKAELITPTAFQALTTRLGYGGAAYLQRCEPLLRQGNFNYWGDQFTRENTEAEIAALNANEKYEPKSLVLRSRKGKGAREVFGVVTDHYTSFDVDKIAEAYSKALKGSGARGRVTYDGNKARFEALFHSDIQPEKYVAGEFFKAGIIVKTDDTGGGSLRCSAVVWQNLCLNLMVIDRAEQPLFRIRHMGSVDELAKRFSAGIEAGQKKLSHFLKVWGFAIEENIIAEARKIDSDVPQSIEEALPGFFRGILERELVLVKGQREKTVDSLLKMYEKDESAARRDDYITRASLVNAFTRFAHEVNDDPWEEDEIQQAAGALLYGRGDKAPAPLPYLAKEK